MKNLLLISLLAVISLLTACGSGSGGATPVGSGTGNFSTASLKGQYAYQIAGTDLTSGSAVPYREAGYFVADGNGNLTSGADDFSETTSGGVQSNSTSGTYSIANDGTGSLVLNVAGGSLIFSLTLVSNTEVLLTEADSFAIASGQADFQTASSLTATPAGTFVFRVHTLSSVSGSASLAGAMTVSGGAITGSDDVLRGSVFDNNTGAPLGLTGSLGAPSNGRGVGSITDASGTVNFIYYVLDSNHLDLLASNIGVIGVGTAEMQSGAPFSNSSLNGSYVFGSRADDSSGLNAQNTVGVFTAGGSGTISTGMLDSVQDGNIVAQGTSLSGTYAVSSNGRVTVTLTPSGSNNIQQVFWMVGPARAYLLTDDTTKVEDGTLDQQQGSSFSASSLNGQYAFTMDGLEFTSAGTVYLTRVGWIIWNGSGTLTWNEAVNNSAAGFNAPGNLPGTYSASSNGRVAATVNNLSVNSNDIVVYLVSGSQAYMLQNDSGVEIVGSMAKQP